MGIEVGAIRLVSLPYSAVVPLRRALNCHNALTTFPKYKNNVCHLSSLIDLSCNMGSFDVIRRAQIPQVVKSC